MVRIPISAIVQVIVTLQNSFEKLHNLQVKFKIVGNIATIKVGNIITHLQSGKVTGNLFYSVAYIGARHCENFNSFKFSDGDATIRYLECYRKWARKNGGYSYIRVGSPYTTSWIYT